VFFAYKIDYNIKADCSTTDNFSVLSSSSLILYDINNFALGKRN
jgi:hypothetical protein